MVQNILDDFRGSLKKIVDPAVAQREAGESLERIKRMVKQDLEFRYEIISLCSALFVWLMIFGLIGMFRQFFSGESSKVRFVSDSAYWLYIAHLPLIQIVQIWVSEWPVPSVLKLAFVCLVTTALLLLSYRYLVRYTLIGTMLNGKRTKI